jgi:hypothetical protein
MHHFPLSLLPPTPIHFEKKLHVKIKYDVGSWELSEDRIEMYPLFVTNPPTHTKTTKRQKILSPHLILLGFSHKIYWAKALWRILSGYSTPKTTPGPGTKHSRLKKAHLRSSTMKGNFMRSGHNHQTGAPWE